jgi:hypothetical protein
LPTPPRAQFRKLSLLADRRPVLWQVVGQLLDSHPVHSRTALVGHDWFQRFIQVLAPARLLH